MGTWTNTNVTVHVDDDTPIPQAQWGDSGSLFLTLVNSGFGPSDHTRVALYGDPSDMRRMLSWALDVVAAAEEGRDAEQVPA